MKKKTNKVGMARSKRVPPAPVPHVLLYQPLNPKRPDKWGMKVAIPAHKVSARRRAASSRRSPTRRSPGRRSRVARKTVPMTADQVMQHEALQILAASRVPLAPPEVRVGEYTLRTRTQPDGSVGVKVLRGPWVTRGHRSEAEAWARVRHIVENDVYDVVVDEQDSS